MMVIWTLIKAHVPGLRPTAVRVYKSNAGTAFQPVPWGDPADANTWGLAEKPRVLQPAALAAC